MRERMRRLAGSYSTYRGLESTEVVLNRGLLYLGGAEGRALIPDDASYETGLFHLLYGASRLPVEFQVRGDDTLLILGRYVYHREE